MCGIAGILTRDADGLFARRWELAYLNGSGDRVDLEYRQRQIDRGLFRRGF